MNENLSQCATATPALTLYYDGACAFCTDAMLTLRRHDRHGVLAFVDIAAPGFADFPPGTDMAALDARLHAVTADGRVLSGLDSMQAAYSLVGMGWAVLPLRIAPLRPALAWAYDHFARNRYRVSRLLGMRLPATHCDGDVCYRGSPFAKGLRDD